MRQVSFEELQYEILMDSFMEFNLPIKVDEVEGGFKITYGELYSILSSDDLYRQDPPSS